MNGHIIGFRRPTKKLEPPYKTPSNTLAVKGLNHFFVVVVFVVNTDAPPVIVKEETEAGEFVAEINKLRAHGGGDCPEYTFKGMLEALYQDPAWGSPMYVFTDAGPKDATEYDIEEVKALASADEYGVTINFFTTGRILASYGDGLMGSSHAPAA